MAAKADEGKAQLMWESERLLGGAQALVAEALVFLEPSDPTNDDLNAAARMLSAAADRVDRAAVKRRRAK